MESTLKNKIRISDNPRWIDITNPTLEELKEYSKQYDLDYYSLSDCLEPAHLPKREQLKDFIFIILRIYDENAPKYPSSIQEMSHICLVLNQITITIKISLEDNN